MSVDIANLQHALVDPWFEFWTPSPVGAGIETLRRAPIGGGQSFSLEKSSATSQAVINVQSYTVEYVH